ncbi:hypothetical protein SAY86_008695 [Trapa natans]|uniref:RING-CH-type domain-containing protein n=1 Tax=Trapa natans TaxID=22666 RepID=A0AAN7KAN2_TRANT|nr:hypothetical protein SAY86_008695 [Trapa natans]
MEEVALLIDELRSSVLIAHCRICHEAELESSRSLESPCACSGTVKVTSSPPKAIPLEEISRLIVDESSPVIVLFVFPELFAPSSSPTGTAYSGGATKRATPHVKFVCRKAPCFNALLLFCRFVGFSAKSYEPGYTATSKKPQLLIETAVTIREQEPISSREETVVWDRDSEADHPECASAADRGAAAFCRSFALTLTGFLLLRQVVDLLDGRLGQYPFTPVTVLLLRVCGIIIPMFALTRAVSAVQNRICGRPYHVIA